jgi:hypothetical protein
MSVSVPDRVATTTSEPRAGEKPGYLAANGAGADDEVTVRHDWSACARSSA